MATGTSTVRDQGNDDDDDDDDDDHDADHDDDDMSWKYCSKAVHRFSFGEW